MTHNEAVLWMQYNWQPQLVARKAQFSDYTRMYLIWNTIPDDVIAALGGTTSFVPYIFIHNDNNQSIVSTEQVTFQYAHGRALNGLYIGTSGRSPFLNSASPTTSMLNSDGFIIFKGNITLPNERTFVPILGSSYNTLNNFKNGNSGLEIHCGTLDAFTVAGTKYNEVINYYVNNDTKRIGLAFYGLHPDGMTGDAIVHTNILCYELCDD